MDAVFFTSLQFSKADLRSDAQIRSSLVKVILVHVLAFSSWCSSSLRLRITVDVVVVSWEEHMVDSGWNILGVRYC